MSTLNHLNGNLKKRRRKNIGIRKYLAQKGKKKKVDALQNNTQFFFKKNRSFTETKSRSDKQGICKYFTQAIIYFS